MTAIEANDLANKTDGIGATNTNALPQWTFNWVGIGFHPEDDGFREAFNSGMDGYLGSEQMLSDVAQYDYVAANVPDDTTAEWACTNR